VTLFTPVQALMLAAVFILLVLFIYAVIVTVDVLRGRRDPAVRRIFRDGHEEPGEGTPQFLVKRHKFPCDCREGGHGDVDSLIDCKVSRMPKRETAKT
jgi:hypothetical protein